MKRKVMLAVNIAIISAVFILNYFYQSRGFDYTLKCVCSILFATLGIINLAYAITLKEQDKSFYCFMTVGLVLCMLGDILINLNFILGAAVFALGHIFFIIAYSCLEKFKLLDLIIGAVVFIGAGLFLILYPELDFGSTLLKCVCVGYALIISLMFGKALAGFIRQRTIFNALLAVGSLLFVFSDLMLVFSSFMGKWGWTNEACMATYYPALCILAFSMFYKTLTKKISQ